MENHILAEHICPPSDTVRDNNIVGQKKININSTTTTTTIAWEDKDENTNRNNKYKDNENVNVNTDNENIASSVMKKKVNLMSPSESITASTSKNTQNNNNNMQKENDTNYKTTTYTTKEKEKDIMSESVKENSARNSANVNLAEAICTSIKESLQKSVEEVDGYANKRIEEVETSEREHFYKMAAFENEMNQLQSRLSNANLRENDYEKTKDTNNKQIQAIQEAIGQLQEMENTTLPKECEKLDTSKRMLTRTIENQMNILDSLKKHRDDIITEFTMGIQAYKNLGLEISSVKEDSYLSIKFTMIDPTNPSRPFIVGLRLEGAKPSWSYRLHTCSPVLPENKAEILVEVLNQSTPKDGGSDCESYQPFASFLKAIRKEFKALV